MFLDKPPAIIIPAAKELIKPDRRLVVPAIGFISSGRFGVAASISNTFIGVTDNVSDLTTYTFSSVSIGAADASRRVVVCIAAAGSFATLVSSATIGGVSATIHVNNNNIDHSSIISALVPTGTTATIAITFSGGMLAASIGVYRQVNESSSTPNATAIDTTTTLGVLTTTIDVPTNGSLYAVVKGFRSGGADYTWTGATERYDAVLEGAELKTGASETGLSLEASRTVTAAASVTSAVGTMAVMTWG